MSVSSPRNCIRTSEKFWLSSITDLISHFTIFPTNYMSLGAKLNSILRLSLIIFTILMFVSYRFAVVFLILAIIINIGFYYTYKNRYE